MLPKIPTYLDKVKDDWLCKKVAALSLLLFKNAHRSIICVSYTTLQYIRHLCTQCSIHEFKFAYDALFAYISVTNKWLSMDISRAVGRSKNPGWG